MFSSSKVVEELLSKSGAIGQEAAKAIADAAMLEVASTNVPHMVMEVSRTKVLQQILTAEYLQQSNGLSLCHFRPQMISMRELRLSILNRFALLQIQFSTWSKHMNPPPFFIEYRLQMSFSLSTDSKRAWDGVEDAHSLFGCRHYNNALWEIDLLKEFFL